jgi:hypothetical protein
MENAGGMVLPAFTTEVEPVKRKNLLVLKLVIVIVKIKIIRKR